MAGETILVVNHDAVFLDLMVDLLDGEGYRTTARRTAQDAYGWLKDNHPDLVILDLQLTNQEPSMSVLNTIRLSRATADIPVIVVATNERFLKEKAETFQRHHVDWLAKPFNLEDLLKRIQALLNSSSKLEGE